ncbi:MAG: radical SAM protein [Elusimicrobia bacterium]|nr:radical SAM protein [Elusimicrobiota bacterium]
MDFNAKPAVVIWEVTQACGLACVHCRAEARPWRDPKELSTEEGLGLVDQIADSGAPLLVLTGGDPMERPDLEAFVRRGVSRGLHVALSPSATPKVTRPALLALKAAGLHRVAVSLDSHLEKNHDAFRRVAGSYRRTLEIARDAREIGLPLQIGTTISALNVRGLEAMAASVEALGVVLWSVFFLVPTGRAGSGLMISAGECEDVLRRLHELSRRVRFAIKTTEGPHYRRVVAERTGRRSGSGINDGKGFAFVSHHGEVFPSGFLPVSAGNVRERSLGEIYRDSPVFRSLRDSSRLKGRCGLCEFKDLCGGSRARAYAATGDMLAEDPWCAYLPNEPALAQVLGPQAVVS